MKNESTITLKPHNIRPYEELCRMLEEHDKAAYISATGTGKSYVVGKYIEEHKLVEDTVVLVPSAAIKANWKKLIPGITAYTYQGLLGGDRKINGFKLIVCDEMHHLGAEIWGRVYENCLVGFSGKIIGVTATPIRFLDKGRDMREEMFEGNVVNGVDLPTAISKGILPSFEYIAALYDIPKKLREKYPYDTYTESLFRQLDVISSRASFQTILKKHIDDNVHKVCVFVNNIAETEKIRELCQSVFPDAEHYIAHSLIRYAEKTAAFRAFESSEKLCFLYTVDILNEGVHISDVDCVVMFRKTESPIVYLQQIGRALSSDNSGKRIKIFDFVANHSNLKGCTECSGNVMSWIQGGITEPQKQIIVSDYTVDYLELLDKLENLTGRNWMPWEDAIIRENYYAENGRKKVYELLHRRRSMQSIRTRAYKLGILKPAFLLTEEERQDIIDTYEKPDGMKLLRERYPELTSRQIGALANRAGKRVKNCVKWSEEEQQIIIENKGKGIEELMHLLPHRTRTAISAEKSSLGLTKKRPTAHQWTEQEDEILRKYPELDAKQLKEKFFQNSPDIYVSAINNRRFVDLKIPRATKGMRGYAERNEELLRELVSAGGVEEAMRHPAFANFTKEQLTDMHLHLGIHSGKMPAPWSLEEMRIVSDYLNGQSNITRKALYESLPGRTPTAINTFILRVKNGRYQLDEKMHLAKEQEGGKADA